MRATLVPGPGSNSYIVTTGPGRTSVTSLDTETEQGTGQHIRLRLDFFFRDTHRG